MSSECKGCLALNQYGQCLNGLDTYYTSETDKCPCNKCIVKMICRDECKEFREFLNTHGPKLFKGKFTFRFRRTHA